MPPARLGADPGYELNTKMTHFGPIPVLTGCVLLVGLVGCEIRLCAFVRPRVPCVSCVSRLPPVSFYRYTD